MTFNQNVIYCTYPIFEMYEKHAAKVYKQLVTNSIDLLLEQRIIDIKIPTTAQVQLNYQEKENRYILNLIHYVPQRKCSEFDTLEDVIPLFNIPVKMKVNISVKKVYVAQTGKELEFNLSNGYISFSIPEVNGYQIIVIEL